MINWKKKWISDENYEAAGVFDVNNDGVLDIVSGAFWYEGPDFRKKHFMGPVRAEGEYFDDFSTIALDVNGDSYLDTVTGGWWGGKLIWRENPKGDPTKQWVDHVIAETGCIETTRAYDIDGDGEIEIIPNTPGTPDVSYWKLIRDAQGRGTGEFRKVTIYNFNKEWAQGHGFGFGDIAGNGRVDIALAHGWLEAPADTENGEWKYHPDFEDAPWKNSGGGLCASCPMIIVDIDGDGVSEIISGLAHGYGLWWAKRDATGKWVYHEIDLTNSQYHDLQWADIDGDGKCELVTGQRHRAHCGNDPGEWDDNRGVCYFKWTGDGFKKYDIDIGPLGACHGTGIQFALADLRGTGRLDIVAPGKGGMTVYYND